MGELKLSTEDIEGIVTEWVKEKFNQLNPTFDHWEEYLEPNGIIFKYENKP